MGPRALVVLLLALVGAAQPQDPARSECQTGHDCSAEGPSEDNSLMQKRAFSTKDPLHSGDERQAGDTDGAGSNFPPRRLAMRLERRVKLIHGVLVYTHHELDGAKIMPGDEDVKTWIIILHKNATRTKLINFTQNLPLGVKQLTRGHPEQGGMPFIIINATETMLSPLFANRSGARYAEQDLPMEAIPELPAKDGLGELMQTEIQEGRRQRFVRSWGIDRIDQRGRVPDGSFKDYPSSSGAGVHVYVTDTGIMTTHPEFEGRAIPTMDCVANKKCVECAATNTRCAVDRHGHGTHVAGTVGGKTVGVARKATIHAIKTLDDDGRGSFSWFLAAIDWVIAKGQKPAVIAASLGGPGYMRSLDETVSRARAAGITVVVAGGNDGDTTVPDACSYSPAAYVDAITVGATAEGDSRAYYSTTGPCIDIFAPGSDIVSANPKGGFTTMSGTSMACPHVAGASAVFLGDGVKPADILATLLRKATKGVITDKDGKSDDSPNKLLYIGSGKDMPEPPRPKCLAKGKGWAVTSGSCCIDTSDNCLVSPGYPSKYLSKDRCRIAITSTGVGAVSSTAFQTEDKDDTLTINNIAWSGSNLIRSVTPRGTITWSTDSGATGRGFRLCPDKK